MGRILTISLSLDNPTQLFSALRRLNNAFNWINLYPVMNSARFDESYPLDRNLSIG